MVICIHPFWHVRCAGRMNIMPQYEVNLLWALLHSMAQHSLSQWGNICCIFNIFSFGLRSCSAIERKRTQCTGQSPLFIDYWHVQCEISGHKAIHSFIWRTSLRLGARVLGTEFPTLNVQVDLINIVYFVRIFKKTDRVLMASHCIWETPNTREMLWKTWVDAPYRYTKLIKSNAQNKIVSFHYSDVTRALWRLRSPDNCLLNSLFKLTRKKQHSASLLASCEGNPLVRSPVDSLHRGWIMSWRDHDFKDMMYMYVWSIPVSGGLPTCYLLWCHAL